MATSRLKVLNQFRELAYDVLDDNGVDFEFNDLSDEAKEEFAMAYFSSVWPSERDEIIIESDACSFMHEIFDFDGDGRETMAIEEAKQAIINYLLDGDFLELEFNQVVTEYKLNLDDTRN